LPTKHGNESINMYISWRQQRKLEAFIEKKQWLPTENDFNLSGEWLKKWVVNILKYKTTKEETAILSRALNFAVSPEAIPTDEYIVATEQACKFLRGGAPPASSKSSGTASLCQTSTVQPVQEVVQALANLAKNKGIIILLADNGKVWYSRV